MLHWIGQLSLLLAIAASAGYSLALRAATKQSGAWATRVVPIALWAHLMGIGVAYAALTIAFAVGDFSIAYVAENSNKALPLGYRLTAVWGEHEGALFLWCLLLALWTTGFWLAVRGPEERVKREACGLLALLNGGLLLILQLTGSPFEVSSVTPLDGRTLNPILQDPAMALHPPLLYAGYAGAAIPFALVVAARRNDVAPDVWLRSVRGWTLGAWILLTLGITIGSWWAYYELGWGGWWYWDPIENLSFIPWLAATGLLHGAALSSQRPLFHAWQLVLVVALFATSLLGIFLGRTGVITSIHSFATDPLSAQVSLAFGALVVVLGCVTIGRSGRRVTTTGSELPLLSRDALLLVSTALLAMAAALVLLGTLFPVIMTSGTRHSVTLGRQFFDVVFLVPALPLLIAAGFGMRTLARKKSSRDALRPLVVPLCLAIFGGSLVPWLVFGSFSWLTAAATAAALWLFHLAIAVAPFSRTTQPRPAAVRRVGVVLAHGGLAVFALGVALVSTYGSERDHRLAPGESVELSGHRMTFGGVRPVEGPNYEAWQGEFQVWKGSEVVAALRPERRVYDERMGSLAHTSIASSWSRDLLVSLGDNPEGDIWALRMQYRPMIRLIWLGTLCMVIGGCLCLWRPRQA